MAVVWTERARDDLRDIFAFIAQDDRNAAARWVDRLVQRAELAATMPFAGRTLPELSRQDIREVLVRSYRIVYRVSSDDIRVLTVFEGHRRLRLSDLEDDA
ncbi:MAG: type II toxin-antitoxin system RelE/ParE family toxin [Myxococcales bacterium]|nr:type II toxin-antitoxin system RelE/ParE family toxin [Myxococcales bacterium]